MRFCILYDSYAKSNSPLKDVDLPGDPAAYLPADAEVEYHVIHKATAVKQIIELSKRNFDVFVNVCDGAWDEDRPGIEVVQALERLGLAFTGADANFYEPSREKMKLVCHYWGIKTPAYVFAKTDDDIERRRHAALPDDRQTRQQLQQHRHGCRIPASPRRRRCVSKARKMIDEFGQALIEEFIEGREFTALVAENVSDPMNPFAYQPVEFHFPPGETFKHFEMKWIDFRNMSGVAVTDPDISRRLQEMTRRLFVGLKGRATAAATSAWTPMANSTCLRSTPTAACSTRPKTRAAPISAFITIRWAIRASCRPSSPPRSKRKEERRRKWTLALNPTSNYGMIAACDIAPGEVIVAYEEEPHVLVSKNHVFANWGEPKRSWFPQYAYPVTDDVYVMWSEEPEDWKPLNHACDPNAWLSGLDLVARRPIRAGEQITVDYATFCNEIMKDFECHCGSPNCRGVIHGNDYLAPLRRSVRRSCFRLRAAQTTGRPHAGVEGKE
ncbi:MAG: SET domain-containing protein-lysine N-methyltransferase [Caldilineaceae bacterium]